MPRSSAGRGQTEPLAALAAVLVVGLVLSIYAGVFEANVPGPVDRNVADPTADRVERTLTSGGVVRWNPETNETVTAVGPEGYLTNVTLVCDGERYTAGPAAPSTADNATRRVSVFRDDGSVVPGRLEVRVWT